MSSSPFELFRNNLKPMMVFLTALALFAFVVLPVLDTYMRRSAGTIGDETVATFGKTRLSRNRVDYFTRNHQSTVRFLVELAEETIRRGGSPQTAGFSFDPQTQRVNSIGINEVPSFQGSIRTLMLASQAQDDGFELDDNTLQVWLQEFTNGMISDGDINAMLMRSTQNQMGRPHLYEQLRSHLLARVYEERGLSGMFLGQSPMSGPLMTPEEQWTNFLKLNRSAVASAYGLLVSDYLPLTNPSPSEEEIKATYEEGKDRDPNDQSADPAFHRRYAAKIEYVSGDFQTFLDAEVAKLSEEAIRAEYEKRLQGGEFRLPETSQPPAESSTPAEVPASSTDSDASQSAVGDQPASEATGQSEPEATEPAVENTGEAEPDSGEASSEAAEGEPSENAQSGEAPEEIDQSFRPRIDSAIRLVSAQQDADQSATTEEESAAESQADQPANDAADNPPAEAADATDTDATDTDATDTDTPDTDTPDTEVSSPSDDTPAATDDSAEPAAPKVESFEDVRQQIAEQMVAEVAREKMDAAMSDVLKAMRRYFSEKSMYDAELLVSKDSQALTSPKKPDLAKLAAELGLQFEEIGPYDQVTIRDEPIARSMELGSEFLGQSANFVQMVYGSTGERSDSPSLPLFAPIRTADGPAGKQYVAWKVEQREAYTPPLDDVRDEVVLAIREKEARQLARDAGEAIIKQASEAPDKSLRDFVPADKMENYKDDLGPFTWMNSFGFAGATIGNVPELDSVGEEFMKAVFESEPGKLQVADSQSGRVVYVVDPVSYEPGLDELRRQFKQPTNRVMAMLLGNGAAPIINDFFKDLDEKAKFKDLTETQQP